MTDVVQLKGVSKRFGSTLALKGVDLTLKRGGPIGLVGPNGAGKTTFLSIISGFVGPDEGTVLVLGKAPLDRENIGRTAVFPQDASFVRTVPVITQLSYLAELDGFTSKQARARAEHVLTIVGLPQVANKSPEQLSHGMLKRVMISQVFIAEPELVLLDEPTAGLDPVSAGAIRSLVTESSDRITFIISSHNLEEIEDLCSSVVILDSGKVVEHRELSELVTRTTSVTIKLETPPDESIESLFKEIEDVTSVQRHPKAPHYVTVHYRKTPDDRTYMQILEVMHRKGVVFVQLVRGQRLDAVLSDIVDPKD